MTEPTFRAIVQRGLFSAFLLLLILCRPGQAQTASIDAFFGCSDVVVYGRVDVAQLTDAGVLYQIRVIRGFKGAKDGSSIMVLAQPGAKVGAGLIMFLQRSSIDVAKFVAANVPEAQRAIFHDNHMPLHVPLGNATAVIETDFPLELLKASDIAIGKEWAHVPLGSFGLPDSLIMAGRRVQSAAGSVEATGQFVWIPLASLSAYLTADAGRSLPCPPSSPTANQAPKPAPSSASPTPPITTNVTPLVGARPGSLDSLPDNVRAALVEYVRGRMGLALQGLTVDSVLLADSLVPTPNGSFRRQTPYTMIATYVDSASGVLGLPLRVGIDGSGRIVDSLNFPDMVHNPAKRNIIPPADAFAIAAKNITEGKQLPSYMEYDRGFGSLLWKFRFTNPKNDKFFRVIEVDAHSGVIVRDYLRQMQ
jgi:hypothetical protein